MFRTDGTLSFFGNSSEIRCSHEASYLASAFWYGCWEIHKCSEKWIQQVFNIMQFVNKRWEHVTRAGGDLWQIQLPKGTRTIDFGVWTNTEWSLSGYKLYHCRQSFVRQYFLQCGSQCATEVRIFSVRISLVFFSSTRWKVRQSSSKWWLKFR